MATGKGVKPSIKEKGSYTTIDNGLATLDKEYKKDLTKVPTLKVTDKMTYDLAAVALSTINEATKKAKAEKAKVLDPAKLTVKRINEQWKPFEDKLTEAVAHLKIEMAKYVALQKAQEVIKTALLMADKRIKNPKTLQTKLAAVKAEPVSNTRSVLKLVITDPLLIPREYLEIDEAKVREALREGIEVPGARLEREQIVVIK